MEDDSMIPISVFVMFSAFSFLMGMEQQKRLDKYREYKKSIDKSN